MTRWQTVRDLKRELRWIAGANEADETAVAAPRGASPRLSRGWVTASLVATAVVTALAVWVLKPSPAPPAALVHRFTIDVGPNHELHQGAGGVTRRAARRLRRDCRWNDPTLRSGLGCVRVDANRRDGRSADRRLLSGWPAISSFNSATVNGGRSIGVLLRVAFRTPSSTGTAHSTRQRSGWMTTRSCTPPSVTGMGTA